MSGTEEELVLESPSQKVRINWIISQLVFRMTQRVSVQICNYFALYTRIKPSLKPRSCFPFKKKTKQKTATETKLCAKIKVDSPKFLITSGQKVNINGR